MTDQLTRADLAGMSPEGIMAARHAGRLDRLMSGADVPPRTVSPAQHAALLADVGADEAAALLARLNLTTRSTN